MFESWPLWAKIGGGLLAAGGVGFGIIRANSKPVTTQKAAPTTQAPVTQPLLMPTMGGSTQAPTPNLPLGGEVWQPARVPLSEDKDVAIANITAGVQSESIKAASALQAAMMQMLFPPVQPVTDGGAGAKPEWRGHDIVQGTEYVKAQMANIGKTGEEAFYRTIYNKAKDAGYSATEVAQSLSSALNKTITPVQVNDYIKQRGLAAL